MERFILKHRVLIFILIIQSPNFLISTLKTSHFNYAHSTHIQLAQLNLTKKLTESFKRLHTEDGCFKIQLGGNCFRNLLLINKINPEHDFKKPNLHNVRI